MKKNYLVKKIEIDLGRLDADELRLIQFNYKGGRLENSGREGYGILHNLEVRGGLI